MVQKDQAQSKSKSNKQQNSVSGSGFRVKWFQLYKPLSQTTFDTGPPTYTHTPVNFFTAKILLQRRWTRAKRSKRNPNPKFTPIRNKNERRQEGQRPHRRPAEPVALRHVPRRRQLLSSSPAPTVSAGRRFPPTGSSPRILRRFSVPSLWIPDRSRYIRMTRTWIFVNYCSYWYKYIWSEKNFFLLDWATKRCRLAWDWFWLRYYWIIFF